MCEVVIITQRGIMFQIQPTNPRRIESDPTIFVFLHSNLCLLPPIWLMRHVFAPLLVLQKIIYASSLLSSCWPRPSFVFLNRVQHHLGGILGVVCLVSLCPIVTDCVREYRSGTVKSSCGNGTTNIRISLEAVLSILIPIFPSGG